MEINIKEQTEKLQKELAQLQAQFQQVEQARGNLINAILKKQGALENLQELERVSEDK